MRKKSSKWTKEVKKAMIDRELDASDLGTAIGGYSRVYISAVINQRVVAPDVIKKIDRFLQINCNKTEKPSVIKGVENKKHKLSNAANEKRVPAIPAGREASQKMG